MFSHRTVGLLVRYLYRERAQQLSLEFASRNVKAELLSFIEECVLEAVRA
jgi:hypothetical protein